MLMGVSHLVKGLKMVVSYSAVQYTNGANHQHMHGPEVVVLTRRYNILMGSTNLLHCSNCRRTQVSMVSVTLLSHALITLYDCL